MGVWNNRQLDGLFNSLFRVSTKIHQSSALLIGGFPSQRAILLNKRYHTMTPSRIQQTTVAAIVCLCLIWPFRKHIFSAHLPFLWKSSINITFPFISRSFVGISLPFGYVYCAVHCIRHGSAVFKNSKNNQTTNVQKYLLEWNLFQISLKFVHEGLIDKKQAFIQVMALRRTTSITINRRL